MQDRAIYAPTHTKRCAAARAVRDPVGYGYHCALSCSDDAQCAADSFCDTVFGPHVGFCAFRSAANRLGFGRMGALTQGVVEMPSTADSFFAAVEHAAAAAVAVIQGVWWRS